MFSAMDETRGTEAVRGRSLNVGTDGSPTEHPEPTVPGQLAGGHVRQGESIIRRAARVAQGTPSGELPTQRLAFLVFDSHDDIALVGSRSAALRPRRMLFQSDPAALDVELRTDRRGSHANMLGQLRGVELSPDARNCLYGASGAVEARIDDQGWFEFDAVKVGTYSATVKLGHTSLEVPSLII